MMNMRAKEIVTLLHRDFLGAHRYTTGGGMCAKFHFDGLLRRGRRLRTGAVLQTAVACREQAKGNATLSLRSASLHYPFVHFAFVVAPKDRATTTTKSADGVQFTSSVSHSHHYIDGCIVRCCDGC
jgi:hypothetical protein